MIKYSKQNDIFDELNNKFSKLYKNVDIHTLYK